MNKLTLFAKKSIQDGTFDWIDDDYRVELIAAGGVIVASKFLTGRILVRHDSGCVSADADDVTFGLITGPDITAIQIVRVKDRRIIAVLDDASGLPMSPNGGDIIITWDGDPHYIFTII